MDDGLTLVSRPWRMVLLGAAVAALFGCTAGDPPVAAPSEPGSAATGKPPATAHEPATASSNVPTVASAQPQIPVTVLGNNSQPSMNPFPADFGPNPQFEIVDGRRVLRVPQARGLDHRPPETKHALLTGPSPTTLVVYDSTGPYAFLGELYAMGALVLASHFGPTASKPVTQYVAGEINSYKALIYVGSTYDEPLPVGFLDDVLSTSVPVIWIYDNIWQLANRAPNFAAKYGYNPLLYDTSPIGKVSYKGHVLTRDLLNGGGIMQYGAVNPALVKTLATAIRADGTTLPWAIRSLNLTFIGESPFGYINSDDRYLIFCDLLFDALAPDTPPRHRGLVRLEDVSPTQDPVAFRAIVDYLYSESVPFSIATIPIYQDPLGAEHDGVPTTVKWTDRPEMIAAMKHATLRGGTLIMHGYTHQFGNLKNPYNGVSADDFEFYLAHVDASNNVIYDGGVPGDSASWAIGRINAGLAAFQAAGLATPTTFEYPHYAGTPTDSKAILTVLGKAYHRGLFFRGDLGINPSDLTKSFGIFYPYTVTDVYGWKVTPENLGNYEPQAYNNHPPRLPADLILSAQNNLVVRDGVASFFFHPYYPLDQLKQTVAGIKASGYTFVSAASL